MGAAFPEELHRIVCIFFPHQFFNEIFRNMLGMTTNGETTLKLVFLALQL